MNANTELSCGSRQKFRLAKNVRLVPGAREWAIYRLDTHYIIRVTPDEGRRIKVGDLTESAIRQLIDAGVYEIEDGDPSLAVQASGESKSSEMPFRSAWLELTGSCNLSCSHCYMNAERKKSVGKANWHAVIEYLAEYGCKQVVFIGGEPLCHPDCIKYVELARRIAPTMRLCAVTNGTLWNESTLERMKQLDVFLKFSLLGSTPERHDRVTGVPGSFDAVVRNLDSAIRLGIRLEITATIVPSSCETAGNMSRFIVERFGNVKHSTTHVRPQGRQIQCGSPQDTCSEVELAVHVSRDFFDLANRRHPCLHGKAAFSYTGLVYPCIMSRYECMTIEDVLKRKPEAVFQRWWTLTKDQIAGCRDCALRYACFDCRGFATSLTGRPCNCQLAAKLSDGMPFALDRPASTSL